MEQSGQNRAQPQDSLEIATLGGGCFWCLEAIFELVEGVQKVESGYSGGTVSDPTYQQVCSGATGHAEVVQVTFDPRVIPFSAILEIFFSVHDPSTPNRQGADIGPQYRSAIFYHSDAQRLAAEKAIEALNADDIWGAPIVTEIAPFTAFYKAESYHQEYYRRNSYQPYCQVVIAPKVAKFRRKHLARPTARP